MPGPGVLARISSNRVLFVKLLHLLSSYFATLWRPSLFMSSIVLYWPGPKFLNEKGKYILVFFENAMEFRSEAEFDIWKLDIFVRFVLSRSRDLDDLLLVNNAAISIIPYFNKFPVRGRLTCWPNLFCCHTRRKWTYWTWWWFWNHKIAFCIWIIVYVTATRQFRGISTPYRTNTVVSIWSYSIVMDSH